MSAPMQPEEPRVAAPGEYLPDLLTPRPPTSPGDDSRVAPDRDPAGNWGVPVEVPTVADSPHWREIQT